MDDRSLPPLASFSDGEMLRSYFHERDIACPRCDCNLRALTGDCCPECGAKLVLALREAEPRQGAWIALTSVLCLNVGIGLLIVVSVIKNGEEIPPRPSGDASSVLDRFHDAMPAAGTAVDPASAVVPAPGFNMAAMHR